MKKFFKNTKNQAFLFTVALVLSASNTFAQTGGVNGLNAATTELKKYVNPVTNIMMAIGVIVGLVGAIKIYIDWNNGDHDVNKKLMGWGGACIFLIVAPLVVKGFFGV